MCRLCEQDEGLSERCCGCGRPLCLDVPARNPSARPAVLVACGWYCDRCALEHYDGEPQQVDAEVQGPPE